MFLVQPPLTACGETVLFWKPPVEKSRIFLPPFGEIFREHAVKHQDRRQERDRTQDVVDPPHPGEEDLKNKKDHIEHQHGTAQLVRAVAAIHEAGHGAGNSIEDVPHGEDLFFSCFSPSIAGNYEQIKGR